MPLTHRGREILSRVPGGSLQSTAGVGCEIVRHEELCVGCGTCAKNCPSGASERGDFFDVNQLLDAPEGSRRGELGAALRRLMQHEPDGPVEVPERVTVYRTIVYDDEKCLGCGTCARGCPADAIEARPPKRAAPSQPRGWGRRHDRPPQSAIERGAGRTALPPTATAPTRPLVLLCECAGTLTNIDFDRLEQHAGMHADVIRGTHWCSRVGQAQLSS